MNLDVQTALNLPDETDAFLQISDLLFNKELSNGYSSFSESEKFFYCVDGFMRGMGNGGVSHFFYNCGGKKILDTLAALTAIKSEKMLKLLEQALACFPAKLVPDDEHVREDLVSALDEQHSELWSEIADSFIDYESELVKQTLNYVTSHLKQFT